MEGATVWREFVSDSDGTVRIDGVPQAATGDKSAYAVAMDVLAAEAASEGLPTLVHSTGQGGESWFTVAADGTIAIAEPPADTAPRAVVVPPAAAAPAPTPAPTSVPPMPPLPAQPAPVSPRRQSSHTAPAPAAAAAEEPFPTRRKPSAADFAANAAESPASPAQDGWRGALNAMSGHSLRLGPGADEMERRRHRASVQRGISGHKTVVMVNLKGGASKTTATYLVGATVGRVRGGNVLAQDNNENQGTLGDLAMPASHDLTATDLLNNIDRFAVPSNSPELMNYMRPQGENRFHVLASQNKASNQQVIDGAAFVQLHSMLRQFYHLIIVDTGNAATASTWQAAVEIADEIVLVALNKKDSTKKLAATVDILVAQGLEEKLSRGILILSEPARKARKNSDEYRASEENREQTIEHFKHYVREVVVVPYDEALNGSRIVYENLAPATQRAYLAATAAIIDGL